MPLPPFAAASPISIDLLPPRRRHAMPLRLMMLPDAIFFAIMPFRFSIRHFAAAAAFAATLIRRSRYASLIFAAFADTLCRFRHAAACHCRRRYYAYYATLPVFAILRRAPLLIFSPYFLPPFSPCLPLPPDAAFSPPAAFADAAMPPPRRCCYSLSTSLRLLFRRC